MDRQGEVLSCCQNVLGLRTTENGTKTDELLQAGARGHNSMAKMLKRIQVLADGWISAKEARHWKTEGQKEGLGKNTRYCGMSASPERRCCRTVVLCLKKGTFRENKATHEEHFPCSWLREVVEGIEERRTERKRLGWRKAEVVKERRREEEKNGCC